MWGEKKVSTTTAEMTAVTEMQKLEGISFSWPLYEIFTMSIMDPTSNLKFPY